MDDDDEIYVPGGQPNITSSGTFQDLNNSRQDGPVVIYIEGTEFYQAEKEKFRSTIHNDGVVEIHTWNGCLKHQRFDNAFDNVHDL